MELDEIEEKNKKYWQYHYGERGRICNINCNILLSKLHLGERDFDTYRLCMRECVRGNKDPTDPSFRSTYYYIVNDKY